MIHFDNIIRNFKVDKIIKENYVLFNVSDMGAEYLSRTQHLVQGNIQNIYHNNEIEFLTDCYIFSSFMNALSYFSKCPSILNTNILLVITGDTPSNIFLKHLNKVTNNINKYYFCINNNIDSKILNIKLYLSLSLENNINCSYIIDTWVFSFGKQTQRISKYHLKDIRRLKTTLRKMNLKKKTLFRFYHSSKTIRRI